MPESNGIEILGWLRSQVRAIPVIFMSGYGDMATVIRIMELGAADFFEKPLNKELLIEAVQRWVRSDAIAFQAWLQRKRMLDRIATLSSRERQVLECVLDGMSNKETARRLGVGPKAIEITPATSCRRWMPTTSSSWSDKSPAGEMPRPCRQQAAVPAKGSTAKASATAIERTRIRAPRRRLGKPLAGQMFHPANPAAATVLS